MEKYLTVLFGEQCGLNANWSVMAWAVNVNARKGIFILNQEDTDNNGEEIHTVTERIYTGEEDQINTLFEGTAQQCIDYIIANNLNPIP